MGERHFCHGVQGRRGGRKMNSRKWQERDYNRHIPEPIPNVPDEAVNEEWDNRVGRATTTATSLDAAHASGNITKTQPTAIPNVDPNE
ncbi:hypothetical protein Tco_1265223 [Tanacetum coccineum]